MNKKDWMRSVHDARRSAEEMTGRRRGPGAGSLLLIGGLGAAIGAAAAFLLDPERGRSRRARYGDQAAALIRDAGRAVDQGKRYVTSTVEGKVAAMRSGGNGGNGSVMPNDAALSDKVETELFSDPAVPKGAININAEQGIVVLRGEVPDAAMRERLESTARGIAGVWEVENLLHLPGEPAPTR